jgi:serine/threonine protein phosphatase PrpC
MSTAEGFRIDGAAISFDKDHTPHHLAEYGVMPPRTNQDAALYTPDVGSFVADGVGSYKGSQYASRLVVSAMTERALTLGVRHMEEPEAKEAIRDDALPYADRMLDRYKNKHFDTTGEDISLASTTLGGLVIARTHLVAVGVGDSPVWARAQRLVTGEQKTMFGPVTKEQCDGHVVSNVINGDGRPATNNPNLCDQIIALPLQSGDRYFIASDGLLGDKPTQRIPKEHLENALVQDPTAQQAAERLANLPAWLDAEDERVMVDDPDIGPCMMLYNTKYDDLSVATLFVN